MFDNALVAAGLLDDPRTMLPRLNKLLEVLAAGGGGIRVFLPVVISEDVCLCHISNSSCARTLVVAYV